MRSTTVTLHFAELLLALLKGKMNLLDALRILGHKDIERPIRDSVLSLLAKMKKGRGFSESLRVTREGRVLFESLYLALIAAAESTGSIETVLEYIVIDL